MLLVSVFGRAFGFHLPGSDAYAGYCMAAAGFLALVYTRELGAHLRATRARDRVAVRGERTIGVVLHGAGFLVSGVFAVVALRVVYRSFTVGDTSLGNDATPLWIVQTAMAVGAVLWCIAMADEFILHLTERRPVPARGELKGAGVSTPDPSITHANAHENENENARARVALPFILLGAGTWISIGLIGIAVALSLVAQHKFGDAMVAVLWGWASLWSLAALPLSIWLGTILFHTERSIDTLKALAPQVTRTNERGLSYYLIPVVLVITLVIPLVLGAIFMGFVTVSEGVGLAPVGALVVVGVQGALTWQRFTASLIWATRWFSMVGLLLSGVWLIGLVMTGTF